MIEFKCTGCAAKLEIDDAQAGHKIVCPQCQKLQDVPGANVPHLGIVCNHCGNELDVEATAAGTLQRCRHCGAMVAIPSMGKDQEGCLGLAALIVVAIVTTGLASVVLMVRG